MRSVLLSLCLVMAAGVAYGFDPERRSTTIGILEVHEREALLDRAAVADLMTGYLRDELRDRGFDAFEAETNLDDLARGKKAAGADYYVEIGAGTSDGRPYGGAGVAGSHIEVGVALIVAEVSAELRLYDGRTLDLVLAEPLHRRNRSVAPVSVGVGSRSFFTMLGLPVLSRLQFRSAAHAVARDAAAAIADELAR